MSDLRLGRLESIHGIAPAFLQRAVIVAVLSFLFFLAMLLVFYIRQNILYFLLSTAFLLVYLLTMVGWLLLRKNILKVYENGILYRKFSATWKDIKAISPQGKNRFEIIKSNNEKVIISEILENLDGIVRRIKTEISARK